MSGGIPIVGPDEHICGKGNALQERNPNINASKPVESPNEKFKGTAEKSQDPVKSNNSKKKEKSDLKAADLADINLDGEESESVPIYATAGDVRSQIKGHLNRSKTAKAAFARELNEIMPGTKVDARGLDRFLKAKGPNGAGHNPVFYAAYVLFERNASKMARSPARRDKRWRRFGRKKVAFLDLRTIASLAREGTGLISTLMGDCIFRTQKMGPTESCRSA
ncbi:hypothetical protein HII31_03918 [Pseudocercospora fuligena]|uniref:DUF7726 domain-containing protein n=1 Tax=Pseudocercospora fuligena TaxID=685502 RepID=A0A8H6RLM2_9PEZI|nr:hypothetical protein HII31_03918 [Pseudocercospora fuligena]